MIEAGLIDMIMRLRGRGISDNAVLRAMELVNRKHFVEKSHWENVFHEQALPIACGQTISKPLTIALMTQMMELSPQHKLLEIGTSSPPVALYGYEKDISLSVRPRVELILPIFRTLRPVPILDRTLLVHEIKSSSNGFWKNGMV